VTRLLQAALLAATALGLAQPMAAAASGPAAAPAIFPVPQSVVLRGGQIAVPVAVRLITTYGSDAAAAATVRATLTEAGLTLTKSPTARLWIYVGRNAYAERQIGAPTAAGLPAEGYVLAAGKGRDGRARVVLDGANRAGQFYAAQTFRQLLDHRLSIPSIVIRDWPSFHRRGVVEGFYGTPWSQTERLSMLDWMAEHKLDFYMYGPKDDAYLRTQWAAPFPAAYRTMLRTLVRRATADHVTLNLVLSPGLSACYSSDTDRQAAVGKLESAYALGVRSFTIAFDDIPLDRGPCPQDAALGTGDASVATAQAGFVNDVTASLQAAHPGLAPPYVVPTVYSGIQATAYTDALAAALAPGIPVQWTGRYGTSVAIARSDADAAAGIYRHPVTLWDNYYVTDYAPQYLALGALDRHDTSLPDVLQGIVADPMQQPQASRIGLFTLADYAWDTSNYQLTASWNASLKEFAGGDPTTTAALAAFADLNWGSLLNPLQAPGIGGAIQRFWSSWGAGDTTAAPTLDLWLQKLQQAPSVLRAQLDNPEFLSEAGPWLDATAAWAAAARQALALLVDTSTGNHVKAGADRASLETLVAGAGKLALQSPSPVVGGGVLGAFVQDVKTQAGG
jgi:hyaluronoglucosaminidase